MYYMMLFLIDIVNSHQDCGWNVTGIVEEEADLTGTVDFLLKPLLEQVFKLVS